MLVNNSKQKFLGKFGEIFERHPAPLSCSIILSLLLVFNELRILNFDNFLESKIKIAFSSAFLASGALSLYLNTKDQVSALLKHGLTTAIAVFVIILGLLSTWFQQSPLFLYPGLGLLLMVAPFFFKHIEDNSVWLYNSRYAIAIVMSIVASLLFGGGLFAISSSLDFLLGIAVHNNVYDVIWIIAIAFVGPVFGLYLIPKENDEQLILPERSSLLARGVTFLINYILTPMLILYLAILHLYAAKILVSFSLPKGQVALMVLTFSLGLTAFVLFARPWVSQCTRLTGWLLRYWHFLLLTPLILLAISVTRRISDYGVTPERYMLVALGLWLLALLIYPLIKRVQLSSAHIISSIAIILILASFGPWGAKGISIASQKIQFVQLLERNGLLDDGQLKIDQTSPPQLTPDDVKTGNSIVRFLAKNDGLITIKPIFEAHSKNPFNTVDETSNQWKTVNKLNALLGFNHNNKQQSNTITYNAAKPDIINIEGYNSYIPNLKLQNYSKRSSNENSQNIIHTWREGKEIYIQTPKGKFKGDIEKLIMLVKKVQENGADQRNNKALLFELKNTTNKATMVINHINARHMDKKLHHIYIDFDLLIK